MLAYISFRYLAGRQEKDDQMAWGTTPVRTSAVEIRISNVVGYVPSRCTEVQYLYYMKRYKTPESSVVLRDSSLFLSIDTLAWRIIQTFPQV